MSNLIITPVYRAYDCVKKMCEAIDKYSVYPYLHILIDDDSGTNEPFPVEASEKRRILLMKRDYKEIKHKSGAGQAMQLGIDWANQPMFNGEKNNLVPYENTFLIESDVVVQEEWDKKMLDIVPTLPSDWLTLDVQSINLKGKLTYPTTNLGNKVKDEREDLEITIFPDFQCTLFNKKIFDSGISFASLVDPADSYFGRVTSELLGGKHYRTKLVSVYHYISQSIKHLEKLDLTHFEQ